jgi:ABC-type transport system involved in multi-copper enzyme maturation permease subunit
MDEPASLSRPKIKRWLPYWAVFQADLRQTLRSWVYRIWVLLLILAAGGYLLNRGGIYHGAGMVQSASAVVGDLLRWRLLGSLTLIIAITGGSISSERGTLADSILSRGISRYQYFMGKWHARLLTVLCTFLAMGLVMAAGSFFFVHEDLSLSGVLMALGTIIALLTAVATCGVTISAMVHNTVAAITILWLLLCGAGVALALLPICQLSPDRILSSLPSVLRGAYDFGSHAEFIGWLGLGSVLVALVGLIHFARCDV